MPTPTMPSHIRRVITPSCFGRGGWFINQAQLVLGIHPGIYRYGSQCLRERVVGLEDLLAPLVAQHAAFFTDEFRGAARQQHIGRAFGEHEHTAVALEPDAGLALGQGRVARLCRTRRGLPRLFVDRGCQVVECSPRRWCGSCWAAPASSVESSTQSAIIAWVDCWQSRTREAGQARLSR
jgi:hypothetical protein